MLSYHRFVVMTEEEAGNVLEAADTVEVRWGLSVASCNETNRSDCLNEPWNYYLVQIYLLPFQYQYITLIRTVIHTLNYAYTIKSILYPPLLSLVLEYKYIFQSMISPNQCMMKEWRNGSSTFEHQIGSNRSLFVAFYVARRSECRLCQNPVRHALQDKTLGKVHVDANFVLKWCTQTTICTVFNNAGIGGTFVPCVKRRNKCLIFRNAKKSESAAVEIFTCLHWGRSPWSAASHI